MSMEISSRIMIVAKAEAPFHQLDFSIQGQSRINPLVFIILIILIILFHVHLTLLAPGTGG